MPDAVDVDATVRDDVPAVAVIVTVVAFVVCQLSVTLCPWLMEFVLAEKTRVGALLLRPKPLQALIPHNASGISPPVMQRILL